MPKSDFNKVEIILRHGRTPVNLLHIFRTPFPKNTSERLLLKYENILGGLTQTSRILLNGFTIQEFRDCLFLS